MSEIFQLLRKSQPGAVTTIGSHIKRGEKIVTEINRRWGVTTVRRWQVKHLRWFLQEYCKAMAPATRYDYWRTIRVMVAALDRQFDWEPHLQGQWVRVGVGGRRPKLAGRARAILGNQILK